MTVTIAQYRVVLHDDQEHDVKEVVEVLRTIGRMGELDARIIAWSTHKEGMAPVKLTTKEYAEFVAERLIEKGFVAHIERVDE